MSTEPLDPITAAALAHRFADDPIAAYRRARDELHAQAVTVLTAMVRQPAPHRTSETDPTTVWAQTDFAGFLVNVLATVTANLGSVDRVLAGRPGSWEAVLVRQLLTGKLGDDERYLAGHRTAPVVVGLNVLDLAAETMGLPDVHSALVAHRTAMNARPENDYDPDQDQRAEDAILDAYAAIYADYAAAFTAAVHRAAAEIPALTVDVVVRTVHDPRDPDGAATTTEAGQGDPAPEPVRNPWDEDDPAGMAPDRLAVRLWQAARAAVPVPVATTLPTTMPPSGAHGGGD